MENKLIFIDIDGTLFDHEKEEIPKNAIHAILNAKEKGHKIFLSTGRPYADIDQEVLNLPLDGMIISCGAVVMVENKAIFSATFPQDELNTLIHFMNSHKIGFSLDGIHKNFLSPEAFDFFATLIFKDNQDSELSRMQMAKTNRFPLEQITENDLEEVVKISIFTKNEQACKKLLHNIPSSLDGFMYKNAHTDIFNAEIMIKNITKGYGLKQIINYLNADISNTIAIGDSLNDLDILQAASISICMDNGAQECKNIADFVTKDISDDGLAYAFKHYKIAE